MFRITVARPTNLKDSEVVRLSSSCEWIACYFTNIGRKGEPLVNLGRFDRKNREANEEAADIQKEVVHGVLSIVEEEGTVRIDLSDRKSVV